MEKFDYAKIVRTHIMANLEIIMKLLLTHIIFMYSNLLLDRLKDKFKSHNQNWRGEV